jgi:hypothetical protein
MKNFKNYYWPVALIGLALSSMLVMCTKNQISSSTSSDPSAPNLPKNFNNLAASVTFVHPGILNTKTTLDYIRTQANDQSSSRYASYNSTVVDFIGNHGMPSSYPSTVSVLNSGSTTTETQFKSNAILAYAYALRWAKTGTASYADNAKTILNGWASHLQKVVLSSSGTQPSQPELECAWAAPTYAAAAEILRYYTVNGQGANWSASDITQFESFMNLLKGYVNDLLAESGFNNNWKVSCSDAKMAIVVFLNSSSVYTDGLSNLKAIMPSVISSDGNMPELCDRQDCVHFQYSLTGLSFGAEIARIQGDGSVYTANSSRISKGYDFMYKVYKNQVSCQHCSGKPVFPGVEVGYRYYKTGNLSYLRGLNDPIEAPSDNTFLGFTTYTHYSVPL